MDVADIVNIVVEINRQIAVDCRRLQQSRNRSLVAELVETGRRV